MAWNVGREIEMRFQMIGWTIYNVDGATFILQRLLNDGQLTVSSGKRETGNIKVQYVIDLRNKTHPEGWKHIKISFVFRSPFFI